MYLTLEGGAQVCQVEMGGARCPGRGTEEQRPRGVKTWVYSGDVRKPMWLLAHWLLRQKWGYPEVGLEIYCWASR